MPRVLSVADCETDPFKIGRIPAPFAWGWYDGTNYHQFWQDQKRFIEFLREQDCICYAHNGGKFDWHFLLPELNPYDEIMIINGRIARCNIGAAECRDSYNILPIPLAEYKKDDIDYAIMEKEQRNKPENKRKISEYLKSDCVYLFELISRFVEKYGVQITQASAAMAQWKKISHSKVPNSGKEFYETFSPYYYGGRVECFESGIIDTDFEVLDINSAYPYAMMQHHPYSNEFTHVDGFLNGADFYRIKCKSKGAFPYRGEGNPGEFAGLRFPNDETLRDFTVTGWEYLAAMQCNIIKNVQVVESFKFFEQTTFADYITHFYQLRLQAQAENDAAGSLFAKLFMNGLYGKMAANPENYRNYMIVPMEVIGGLESQGWSFCGEIGPWGLAEAPLDESQQRYYNVATGASITGYVRAMLLKAITTSEGVLYCDTDSIAVRKRASNIVLSNSLGDWKLEGKFDKAGIAGKKLYIFRGAAEWWKTAAGKTIQSKTKPRGGKRLIKMASKGARLTEREIWEVASGAVVNYMSAAPTFSVTKAPAFINRRIKYTAAKR